MKNPVLVPILALLVLLGIGWVGLFGLTQATSAVSESRPAQSSSQPMSSRSERVATTDHATTTGRSEASNGTDTTGSGAARDDRDVTLESFLDRVSGHRASGGHVTDSNPRDNAGMSNRGAMAVILVLGLIALVGGSKKKGK